MAGPIGVLVLVRGLAGRFASGAAVAVGSALPEAGYACLAFWGVSELLARYDWLQPVTRLVTIGILGGLGVVLLRAPPGRDREPGVTDGSGFGLVASFVTGFGISSVNPALFANWAAAVTAVNATNLVVMHGDLAVPFAAAVGMGIIGWFFLLLLLLRRYRQKLGQQVRAKITRFIGGGLCILALLVALQWAGVVPGG